MLRPAYDDVRLDADAAQLLDAVLGRFRLHFSGSLNVRNQRDMDIHDVVTADIALDLPDRFEERQALDIADRAADFRNDDVRLRLSACPEYALLNFIRNMRDHLHGAAQIFAAALFRDDGGINFACCDIAVLRQINVDKSLVMTQDPGPSPRRHPSRTLPHAGKDSSSQDRH